MALAAVERNALLEQVWELQDARDYVGIVEVLGTLPQDELVSEPELGVTLCHAWYRLGELNKSILLIQQLTTSCERRGNTRLCRRRMNNEALIRLSRGELEEAEALLRRIVGLAEEAGDHLYLAWVQNNLGILYYMKGLWEFSLSYCRRAIVAGQRLGDVSHLLMCHVNAANTYRKMGSVAMARVHQDQAIELLQEVGKDEAAHAELSLAFQLEAEGDLSLAKSVCDRVLHRFGAIGHSKGQGGAYQVYGRIHLKEGRFEEAQECLMESLSRATAASHKEVMGSVMEDLARIYHTKGDTKAFTTWLNEAIMTHTEVGNHIEAVRLRTWLQNPN